MIFTVLAGAAPVPQKITKKDYLNYIQAATEDAYQTYDADMKKWRENVDLHNYWGYMPSSLPIHMAFSAAFLYQKLGSQKYLDWAKQALLDYGAQKSAYPESWVQSKLQYQVLGLPAVTDIFSGHKYMQAYRMIRDQAKFTPEERTKIEGWIAESADFAVATQEWGAMNRATLRADFLMRAAQAIPQHPHAANWTMYAQAMASDSWGKWEIEDATGYHGIWLWSLLSYADAIGDARLVHTPEMYYYAQYYLNLISPVGTLVEFGDAEMHSAWFRFIPFFEKCAAAYQDPHLKWAANHILTSRLNLNAAKKSISFNYMFIDCYSWGDDNLNPREPDTRSAEVMDDIVGKKIVFRTGWDPKSTFMFLNYRDEGDGGWLDRDYLRNTIPVDEEKMTHGHADENNIGMLMQDGCLLLYDAGYRDYMPSGLFGAYRQDYFHNRICVRQEKMWTGQKAGEFRYSITEAVPGQSVLDFLRNAGSYRRVRTQKIDFLTFENWEMSRTRVIDDKLGYEWDRVINYLKDPEMFIVFDIVRAQQEEFYTAANLWHTHKILNQGEHWYDTVYDSLRHTAFPTHKHLLIYFPETDFKFEGVEQSHRNWQSELTIHQTATQHFFPQDVVVFTTVLIPHDADAAIADILAKVEKVQVDLGRKGVGIKVKHGAKTFYICSKTDLLMDFCRDNQRPRYHYDAGKLKYDDFETDANALFACVDAATLDFMVVNAVKMTYRGQTYFEQPNIPFGLASDGKPDRLERGKVRYWKESVKVTR